MANVKYIRLISGEELVSEVTSTEGSAKIELKNPCMIGVSMGAAGQPSLSMQPYLMFTSDKSIQIKDEHIMFVANVDIKLLNKYNEIFGSGIVIAQQGIVTK
jgi:hypothetical protein